MSVEKLLALRKNLDELVRKNDDLLNFENSTIMARHAIDTPEALRRAFESIESENRLMEIGVVGRVKAGKSSLLNALLFDGQAVLPKAATPMTAALTTLSYGEKLTAEVEFFSPDDIKNFRDSYQRYESRLEALRQKYTAEFRLQASSTMAQEKKTVPSGVGNIAVQDEDNVVIERANRKAQREIKADAILCAAYDQYCRMKNSGIEISTLGENKVLLAPDMHSLGETLLEFVGADGRYMPFTKSVHIFLPLDALKDIRIIDTPGLNDPVLSREARTCELLKFCDVIFIVSSAGQFLSNEDLQLMGRITQKEGVRELCVVASQIDNQLFGSEIQPRLPDVLKKITTILSQHMAETLHHFKVRSPEIGNTFDSLIEQAQTKILYSSGICHSLSARFDQRDSWDAGASTVWENLLNTYPDYFSIDDKELSVLNLNLLANTNSIQGILKSVRAQKEQIIEVRRHSLVQAKGKALEAYRTDLLIFSRKQLEIIKGGNLDVLQQQSEELASIKSKLSLHLSSVYKKLALRLCDELHKNLNAELDKAYRKADTDVESATGNQQEKNRSEKEGVCNWVARHLWGGGYESYSYSVKTVVTTQVYSAIGDFVDRTARTIQGQAESSRLEWQQDLYRDLFGEYRKTVGDRDVDELLVVRTLDGIIQGIALAKFPEEAVLSKELSPRGTLTGSDADKYIETAKSFLVDQKSKMSGGIKNYITQLEFSLNEHNIAQKFFEDYDHRINQLKQQIANQGEIIERFSKLIAQLQHLEMRDD